MRVKHFLKLKEKTNQETWIILTQYNLASILYRLDKNFKYMISNNTIKTEKPNINFYYEDIITYLKNKTQYLNSEKLQTTHHKLRGKIYGKTNSIHITGQKTTTYSTYSYILRPGLMIKYIDGLIKNI